MQTPNVFVEVTSFELDMTSFVCPDGRIYGSRQAKSSGNNENIHFNLVLLFRLPSEIELENEP